MLTVDPLISCVNFYPNPRKEYFFQETHNSFQEIPRNTEKFQEQNKKETISATYELVLLRIENIAFWILNK